MENDQKNLAYKIVFVVSIILNLFFLGKYSLANIDKMTLLLSKTRAATTTPCNTNTGCFIGNKCYSAGDPGQPVGQLNPGGPQYCCFSVGKGKRSSLSYNHLDPCGGEGSAPTPTPTPIPLPCGPTQSGAYGTRWCNKCDAKTSYGNCSKGAGGILYRCVGPNSLAPPVPKKFQNLKYNIFVPDDVDCKKGVAPLLATPMPTRSPTPTSIATAPTQTPTPTKLLPSSAEFDSYCSTPDDDGCLKMGCNGVDIVIDVYDQKKCVSYYTKKGNNDDCDQNDPAFSNKYVDAIKCKMTVEGIQ